MTPNEIEFTRELLAALPEDERPILARAAAEFIRLHDALQRLYRMTPADVQRDADFLGVRPAILADTVEQIVRRYVQ
jgi:hypothetical protein